MNQKTKCIILILLTLILVSCNNKTTAPNGGEKTVYVYIAGDINDNPPLWVNGVQQTLWNGFSFASSVYVDRADVYVAGSIWDEEERYFRATLRKNGIAQRLSCKASVATSVFVIRKLFGHCKEV